VMVACRRVFIKENLRCVHAMGTVYACRLFHESVLRPGKRSCQQDQGEIFLRRRLVKRPTDLAWIGNMGI